MALSGKTFGDFFDAVYRLETLDDPLWMISGMMNSWKNQIGEAQWEKVRATSITDELVVSFAEDMVASFNRKVDDICSAMASLRAFRKGKGFLQGIVVIAQQFGVDLSEQIYIPDTLEDMAAFELEY